jgi:8-oxo-dGTP pyrophosphatase MutT (NUDIX family)
VWTFPKGHPEKDESDQEAALREVREETGWECTVEKPLLDVQYFYVHNKFRIHKTVRWFLMRPVRKSSDFDPVEILQTKWVSLEEAKKLVSYGTDVKLLQALNF